MTSLQFMRIKPTDDRWFKVQKHSSRDVFPTASFAEESLKAFVAAATLRRKHAIGLYAVL